VLVITVPIHFRYDTDLKILFTTAEGLITFAGIQAHLDEEIHAGYLASRKLIDASMASTDINSDQVRLIAHRLKSMTLKYPLGPTAVVSAKDYVFGMTHMLAIILELHDGPRIAVFRTFDEALNWLLVI
jgi:hypothetical protein